MLLSQKMSLFASGATRLQMILFLRRHLLLLQIRQRKRPFILVVRLKFPHLKVPSPNHSTTSVSYGYVCQPKLRTKSIMRVALMQQPDLSHTTDYYICA